MTVSLSTFSTISPLVLPIIGFLVLSNSLFWISDRLRQSFYLLLCLTGLGILALNPQIPELARFFKWPIWPAPTILFLAIPILLFEMAFNINLQKIRPMLSAIFWFGIFNTLMSIAGVSLVAYYGLHFSLPLALLFGTVLNTTYPYLTLQIFKKINAPQKLSTLLIHESILNQMIVIILSQIICVYFISHSSNISNLSGIVTLSITLLGTLIYQILVGFGLGWCLTQFVLKWLNPDRRYFMLYFSLAISLAYFNFLISETVLQISGTGATVATGLVFGYHNRLNMTASHATFLKQATQYCAYFLSGFLLLSFCFSLTLSDLRFPIVTASLIFLITGLIRTLLIASSLWFLREKKLFEPVSPAYQAMLIGGGLKSPLSVVLLVLLSYNIIVTSDFNHIILTTILLSWFVQGLILPFLTIRLPQHNQLFNNLLATTHSQLHAAQYSQDALHSFQAGGLFSQKIQKLLATKHTQKLNHVLHAATALQERVLEQPESLQIQFAFHRCFAIEKQLFSEFFEAGQFSQSAFRQLDDFIDTQLDYSRHIGPFSEKILLDPNQTILRVFEKYTQKIPGLNRWTQSLLDTQMSTEYEVVWALRQGASNIISQIQTQKLLDIFPDKIQRMIQTQFQTWENISKAFLDHLADQFPEFVHHMQLRLANRLLFNAQIKSYQHAIQTGLLSPDLGDQLIQALDLKTRQLRPPALIPFQQDPHELLLKIPVFKKLSIEDVETILNVLISHTYRAGETILSEGETSRSMYIIARGVVRVTKNQPAPHPPKELATLFAGDFFGETGLLHPTARTANCIAVTPCALFELSHDLFELLLQKIPIIQTHLAALEASRQ